MVNDKGGTSQSQPIPAATQRFAKRASSAASSGTAAWAKPGKRARSTSCAWVMAPQRYCRLAGCQCKALQAPLRRPDSSTPKGQGSIKQHTPHPLQGAPNAGLGGASGSECIVTVRMFRLQINWFYA
jgi:hypothetical protein